MNHLTELLSNSHGSAAAGAIPISFGQLALCLVFVVVVGAISLRQALGLEKNLALGTVRSIAQLTLMGYVLRLLFALDSPWLMLAVFAVMTWFAADIVRGRVKKQNVAYFMPTLLVMQIVYFLVTCYVTGVIIRAEPWWMPQYFIPVGGMVAGNSMNALAISLDRFFSDLKSARPAYEMQVTLGATPEEASRDVFRNALRAGMIPSINSLMGAGIVSIPGMMTGQILAGGDPAEASRYQIVVMLMMVAATALASFAVLHLVRRRCFTSYGRLKL